jgi:hypothetical protein
MNKLRVICAIAGEWGKLDLPAMSSHSDVSESVRQGGEIGIQMGDHKYQDSSTSELCCTRKLAHSIMYLPQYDTRSTLRV